MNPLIGIAAGILPDIIKLIAGDKTGQLADQVGKAVVDAVGSGEAAPQDGNFPPRPRQKRTRRLLKSGVLQRVEELRVTPSAQRCCATYDNSRRRGLQS
jgi:hypothetical protein